MPKLVDHEARRLAISGAAAGLIAQGGLEAATIRAIAQESGHSKGVIEHYFENKEELLEGALDWANHRYEQRVSAALNGLSGLDSLRKRIEATIPANKSVRDEWKVRLVFWSMAAIKRDLRRKQKKRFLQAVESFELDLIEAIAREQIDKQLDTNSAARRLVNMTTGISTAALHNPSLYTPAFISGEIDNLMQSFIH
jgi:AcrR family transcriptional regulator